VRSWISRRHSPRSVKAKTYQLAFVITESLLVVCANEFFNPIQINHGHKLDQIIHRQRRLSDRRFIAAKSDVLRQKRVEKFNSGTDGCGFACGQREVDGNDVALSVE